MGTVACAALAFFRVGSYVGDVARLRGTVMRLATREERRANFRNWRLMLLGAFLGLVGVALADYQWVILGFMKSLSPR